MAESSEHPAAERDFSPLNPLDSEVCGASSSHPLSFPSQPPDIRIWFSSYEYESPECSALAHDLHSFFLPPPAEDDSETQDPLGTSPEKAEDPTTLEDKPLAAESPLLIPRERDLNYGVRLEHNSCPVTDSIPWRENSNLLPEFGGKFPGKHDRSKTVDEKFVEGHKQSPKWIPAKTKSKESSPISPKMGKDWEVAVEAPHKEGLLQEINIRKDGFVSVKNKDSTRGNGETSPCSSGFNVKYENLIADESFRENGSLPLKRKQNLQQLFGEGFLAKYSTEENNDLISSKIYRRSPAKDGKCSPKLLSEMSECKGISDAKDWRRDDNKYSCGKIKEEETSQEKLSFSRWFMNEGFKENAVTCGFVSTRNREITDDDSRNLPPKSVSVMNYKDTMFENGVIRGGTNEQMMDEDYYTFAQNDRNLEGKEEEEARKGKRSPLADTTNLQAGVAAVAPEIPRKWRCPRRSKPYMGPPLKQLRLERWINRAT